MAKGTYEEAYSNLIKEIRSVALYKHRYDVFRDFVTMTAISLHNAVHFDQPREDEYLKIIGSYEKKDQLAFPALLGLLVTTLEFEPKDVLGTVYMDLELGSRDKGQFFTPSHICEFMAQIVHGDELSRLFQPFITLSEPACGAGGMVLAFVKEMLKRGHNPAERLWTQCTDVDRLAALMTFVQLTLWNVPAEVIVGNSLSLEVREVWHTPQHILGFWSYRLAKRREEKASEKPQDGQETVLEGEVADKAAIAPSDAIRPVQFDFGF